MTSLTQLWSAFLQSPSLESLTPDATLTYITSCKQFSGPQEIVQQLAINRVGLKSLKDEVVSSHEASDSLVSEVAASFIFEFDGKMNPFLPGLEDNMYSGKRVEVPLIYAVIFDAQRIRAIRVFWDQATVLKQIDVIGARGRGWPVYDGLEQSRLLKAAIKPSSAVSRTEHASRPTTATRDPHASLHLFERQAEEPRSDYGPQDYQPSVKAAPRDYDELFVNEKSARPDEMTKKLGSGPQRQATFGQSQYGAMDEGMRNVRLDESIGHAGRTSHFEFGSPNANSSDYQKNEIPLHRKGGIQDHNRTTNESNDTHMRTQRRSETDTHFSFGSDSQSPAVQNGNHRGPPQASFDAFSDEKSGANVHGREFNMSRRPPPQSQFEFGAGDDDTPPPRVSRAASHNYQVRMDEERSANEYNRDANKSRRPPPQAQYDLMGDDNEPVQSDNVHGREFNMSRRPPPQAQYNFMEDSETPVEQTSTRAKSAQRNFTPTDEQPGPDNIHGRQFNMSRRPPPQAQYDFMGETASAQPETFGRRSQQANTATSATHEPGQDNIHGRAFNMSRRPPPQAQYDFMGDADAQQDSRAQTSFGRASQRDFTPSYEFGDESSDHGNIHGRTHNMGRQGPPAPQNNLFE